MTATRKQLAVVAFLRRYQRDNGMPPSLREMCAAFGWASTNTATTHLQALERQGLVRHREGKARGWVVAP